MAEPRDDAEDFAEPRPEDDVLAELARELDRGRVHTTAPGYFGHFTSAPCAVALRAEALASTANAQLATRSHAAWAVDTEARVVSAIAQRFGLGAGSDGLFTSGGAEANAVAVQLALAQAFPDLAARGLRALPSDPVLYVSDAGHASVRRAARLAGLGDAAVRVVPTDDRYGMKPTTLGELVARDRARGLLPFLLVATIGTTGSGAIDPVAELAAFAARQRMWLHVDAAWGGLAAFVPRLRAVVAGTERADSITFDPHKALAVPLGAGMLLTRDPGALARVYAPGDVRGSGPGYMPKDASRDPYARGPQWSRRFLGAPTWAVLASRGFGGVAEMLEAQVARGERLRGGLAERGWRVVNDTPLPVVCFVEAQRPRGAEPAWLDAIARAVIAEGTAWLSLVRLATGARVLRACVTSPRTRAADVDALLDALDRARAAH
jgi:glutamate/tyrosine decarboxylase-like PLP-dependent enzyme